jgi:hypothetical protein
MSLDNGPESSTGLQYFVNRIDYEVMQHSTPPLSHKPPDFTIVSGALQYNFPEGILHLGNSVRRSLKDFRDVNNVLCFPK